jgi:hypothetical protein
MTFDGLARGGLGTNKPVQRSQAGPYGWVLSNDRRDSLLYGRSGFGPMGRYRRRV